MLKFPRKMEIRGRIVVLKRDEDYGKLWRETICPKCNRPPTPEGHDACLGHIPGVRAACCGHGTGPSYIWFENGTIIRDFATLLTDKEDHDYLRPKRKRRKRK
jgi:hypothetical protein